MPLNNQNFKIMKFLVSSIFLTILVSNIMAKELKTEILINASPEKVWSILTNFKEYPQWNPFIKSITGEVSLGKKFKAVIGFPGEGMTFKPKVLAFKKNKEFRWKGHLFISGLFDGEHKFELVDNGNGTTTFKQSEKFGGILIPFFKKMLNTDTLNGFNAMNMKLKELAEKN